jgi:DNA (cytosine-5)-methyltransferase 1
MSTRPRLIARGSGQHSVPAPVAVSLTTAGAVRAATARTVSSAALTERLSVPVGPGPVIGSVCTGYGGLDLGVLAAFDGGRIAWCADPDPHIAAILARRMPGVPNHGDVRAIDWASVEPVEVLTAGFPCQDISAAGRRAGIENGARSGLWTDIVAGIRLLRPALLVVENVAALRWKAGGLHRVLGDLAEAGYDAAWRSVRAADIGAAHRRERVFLLAWPRPRAASSWADRGVGNVADADRARRFVQRHLRHQQTGRPVVAGPVAAAADAYGIGREELHTPDPDGWSVAARPGPAPANTERFGHRARDTVDGPGVLAAVAPAGATAGGPRGVPAHPEGDRRDEGLPRAARVQGRPDAAFGGYAAGGSGRRHRQRLVAIPDLAEDESPTARHPDMDWGVYAPAIRRWEQVVGRSVPCPTQLGRHGRPVLAPAFVEWLQGLQPGWVTDLGLPRTAELRALGNGVVPQQATHAVALLLRDLAALLGAANGCG